MNGPALRPKRQRQKPLAMHVRPNPHVRPEVRQLGWQAPEPVPSL